MAVTTTPSLFRRTLVWFILALVGNIGVLAFAFIVSSPQTDSVMIADALAAISAYARPMLAPELLLFTTGISVLSGLRIDQTDVEGKDAARLIAWAIRAAMALVLSFTLVIVIVDPKQITAVLFALLLAFVTFVLAEKLAPPISLSAAERFHAAAGQVSRRESWANSALGLGWREGQTRFARTRFTLLALTPFVVQTVAGIVISVSIWGTGFGLSPTWVFLLLMMNYPSVILAFAWLFAADKADSPQARAWRRTPFALLGAIAAVAFSIAFFTQAGAAHAIGWLVLVVSTLFAFALWGPLPGPHRRILDSMSATLTARHLDRTIAYRDKTYATMLEEQTTERLARRRRFWRRFGLRT